MASSHLLRYFPSLSMPLPHRHFQANGQFGFKSNIIDCESAEDGDFTSTSLGTMVGTCSAIST